MPKITIDISIGFFSLWLLSADASEQPNIYMSMGQTKAGPSVLFCVLNTLPAPLNLWLWNCRRGSLCRISASENQLLIPPISCWAARAARARARHPGWTCGFRFEPSGLCNRDRWWVWRRSIEPRRVKKLCKTNKSVRVVGPERSRHESRGRCERWPAGGSRERANPAPPQENWNSELSCRGETPTPPQRALDQPRRFKVTRTFPREKSAKFYEEK